MHNVLVVDETDTAVTALQNAVDRADREQVTLVVANVMPESVYELRHNAILAKSRWTPVRICRIGGGGLVLAGIAQMYWFSFELRGFAKLGFPGY